MGEKRKAIVTRKVLNDFGYVSDIYNMLGETYIFEKIHSGWACKDEKFSYVLAEDSLHFLDEEIVEDLSPNDLMNGWVVEDRKGDKYNVVRGSVSIRGEHEDILIGIREWRNFDYINSDLTCNHALSFPDMDIMKVWKKSIPLLDHHTEPDWVRNE